uniref:ribosomal protein L22 n=1 Tax=Scleria parvula TaxID=388579 RepID=UPI001F147747|nr:ribosomal protein L22 [Scleria parvula]ULQ67670.1 ribosomal protein L22 [Scleria parvula]
MKKNFRKSNLMKNLKKLRNNPIKKNASSSSGKINTSVSKARRVIDQIRGRSYKETKRILDFLPYKASSSILKLVDSAARNANYNMGLNETDSFISRVEVNKNTVKKKVRPRAQGHSYPIKRTVCHITIVLKEKSKSLFDQSKM